MAKPQTKIPRKMLDELKAARKAAQFDEMSQFDWADSKCTVTCRSGDFEGRPDTFIKERTRIYRQSWIIPQLDAVIAWAEGRDVR
jgi:hypothetical protein